jgi:hypothetical protein
MTWHGGMVTLVGGEMTPRRRKRGDNASWDDVNFTGPKNKENPRGRFSYYKWTMNILSNDELI